jgi:phasin family protein
MMMEMQNPLSSATKTHIDAQITLWNTVNDKTLDSMERLTSLNLRVMRSYIDESTNAVRQLLTARDPQQGFLTNAHQAQPNMEKVFSYGREVAEIVTGTQAEIIKAAEQQINQTRSEFGQLMEEFTKNVPQGSDSMFGMMKSVFDTATEGYEQMMKNSRPAMEAMGNTYTRATSQFAETADRMRENTERMAGSAAERVRGKESDSAAEGKRKSQH